MVKELLNDQRVKFMKEGQWSEWLADHIETIPDYLRHNQRVLKAFRERDQKQNAHKVQRSYGASRDGAGGGTVYFIYIDAGNASKSTLGALKRKFRQIARFLLKGLTGPFRKPQPLDDTG